MLYNNTYPVYVRIYAFQLRYEGEEKGHTDSRGRNQNRS